MQNLADKLLSRDGIFNVKVLLDELKCFGMRLYVFEVNLILIGYFFNNINERTLLATAGLG